MNKRARLLAIIMVIVMCIGTIQPIHAYAEDETTTNLTTPEEGKILFETDFAESNPFRAVKTTGNTINLVTDDDAERGQVLELKRTVTGDLRIDTGDDASPVITTFTSTSSSIVYEFEVKVADLTNTTFNFNVRKKVDTDGDGTLDSNKYSYPCSIVAGALKVGSTVFTTLSADTWYKISVVQNYGTGYKDVYLNGEKISTDNTLAMEAYFDTTDGASDALRVAFETSGSADSFKLDNIKIYEGTQPITSSSDENTGNLTTPEEGKILFETDFAESSVPFRTVSSTTGTFSLVTDSDSTHGQILNIIRKTSGDLRVDTGDDASPKITTFTSTSSSIVYEFEVKIADLANTAFSFNVRKKVDTNGDGTPDSNKYAYPCRIVAGGGLSVNNIQLASLSQDTWYKISVVQNYGTGYKDVYLDGVKISSDNTLAMEAYFDTADGAYDAKRVAFEATGSADNFSIDNVKIYEGTQPIITSGGGDEESGDEETGDDDGGETTVTLRDPVEGTKIYETDFELTNPFYAAVIGGSGTITRVQESSEHGYVMEIQRIQSGELRLDPTASKISTDANAVVYEFDVKLLDLDTTIFHLLLRQTGGSFGYVVTIKNGEVLAYRGTADSKVATLTENTWYTVSVVQNYKTGYRDIYIDGVKVTADNTWALEEAFAAGTTNLDRAKFETGGTADHFMLDNFRVYEGTYPHTGELLEPEEEEVVITIDPTKSVFEMESLKNLWGNVYLDTLLEGYVALHTRSGVVYKDGEKTLLETLPAKLDEGYSVVLSEICAALELTYTVDGTTASISSTDNTIQNQTVTVYENNSKIWVDAEEFLGIYGVVSIDTNEKIKSGGMMIAGPESFVWPSDEDTAGAELKTYGDRSMLENLNEYLFLEQPSAEEILALYQNSSVSGQHPRIHGTAADFARIKSEIANDELMNTWYQQLIAAADYLVNTNTTPLVYEFRDGVRLLYVSRDMLDHMYTLGMAYQLTGEQKYVNRAWVDLESVCEFPNWNPNHSLDTVEMTAAVAIGYDWMYSGLSEEQRAVVEEGLYKHAFVCAVSGYQDGTGVVVLQDGNWNVIINSGFTLGALALMDVYPEISSYIVSGAVRAVESMLIEFGPDGAWKEGPNYWEYTMQYAAKMLSGLETVFGTCFSLDKIEGLSTAGNYILHVQSDKGLFNYGDANASHYYVPEIFYLADKYENGELMATLLNVNHGEMLNCEDVVLSLLWYDDAVAEDASELPVDGCYWTEGVATFRDKWSDGVTAFAGIHGGKTNVMHSQIDGGSFVYDYAGIRWAREIGMTPYNTSVTSDRTDASGRWLLYNSKAEAHNTLVINPDGTAEQVISSTARMLRFESAAKGGIAVLDLSENYAVNASSAIRGIFFTDDRTSLVVRDEITLKEDKANSTIYWFMQTDAEITVAEDGKSATLTQDGKQVILEFVTSENVTATLIAGTSTRELLGTTSPLAGTSEESEDVDHSEINRIAIKVEGASGNVTITAKLTPVGVNSTPISDYNVSISSWSIPEGEIAAKPEVQSVVIDGREIEFDDANQATFLSVEGTYNSVPEILVTLDETKFSYTVTEATTMDGGIATIVVSDKTNPQVVTAYTVVFEQIPVAVVPEGFTGTALQVIGAKASAEPEAANGYVAWKVLDQDTDSRWTSQGIGNWILLELEAESTVDHLIILFKKGNERSTYFTVSVSTDGVNYETVYSGQSAGTALGSAEAYEQFALGGKTAKYIKIGCNGNSKQGVVAGWNNIGEVVFTGSLKSADYSELEAEALIEQPAVLSSGTTTSYTKESDGSLSIHCSGAYHEFMSVAVDDNVIANTNYTVTEGSTIITFDSEYLDTLQAGKHTVTLFYTGDRSVDLEITILAAVEESTTASQSTESEESTEASQSPEPEESTEVSQSTESEESTEASQNPEVEGSTEEASQSTEANESVEDNTGTEDSGSMENGTNEGEGEGGESVPTGDNRSLTLWCILLVMAATAVCLMCDIKGKVKK